MVWNFMNAISYTDANNLTIIYAADNSQLTYAMYQYASLEQLTKNNHIRTTDDDILGIVGWPCDLYRS